MANSLDGLYGDSARDAAAARRHSGRWGGRRLGRHGYGLGAVAFPARASTFRTHPARIARLRPVRSSAGC